MVENQEEKEEVQGAAQNNDEGIQQETTGLVESAHQAAEKLKVENDRREKLLAQEQEMLAKRMLGGKADAGTVPEVKKEETPAEYKERVLRGELN